MVMATDWEVDFEVTVKELVLKVLELADIAKGQSDSQLIQSKKTGVTPGSLEREHLSNRISRLEEYWVIPEAIFVEGEGRELRERENVLDKKLKNKKKT